MISPLLGARHFLINQETKEPSSFVSVVRH